MRLRTAPLLILARTTTVVLGFDLIAALATRFAHVPYVDFMLPDFLVFTGVGYVLARHLRGPGKAIFYVAVAALIEATAGRALATALAAEAAPPATSASFLALETIAVGGFTTFWGAMGVGVALLVPRRRIH